MRIAWNDMGQVSTTYPKKVFTKIYLSMISRQVFLASPQGKLHFFVNTPPIYHRRGIPTQTKKMLSELRILRPSRLNNLKFSPSAPHTQVRCSETPVQWKCWGEINEFSVPGGVYEKSLNRPQNGKGMHQLYEYISKSIETTLKHKIQRG